MTRYFSTATPRGGKRFNSRNDVACTSEFLFFTDPCYGDRLTMELDHDSVYRIDPQGTVELVLTQKEIQRPNGIHVSPDQKTLYLVDSCPVIGGNRKIWAFDLDANRRLSNQRAVYDFAPGRGGDGMPWTATGCSTSPPASTARAAPTRQPTSCPASTS